MSRTAVACIRQNAGMQGWPTPFFNPRSQCCSGAAALLQSPLLHVLAYSLGTWGTTLLLLKFRGLLAPTFIALSIPPKPQIRPLNPKSSTFSSHEPTNELPIVSNRNGLATGLLPSFTCRYETLCPDWTRETRRGRATTYSVLGCLHRRPVSITPIPLVLYRP